MHWAAPPESLVNSSLEAEWKVEMGYGINADRLLKLRKIFGCIYLLYDAPHFTAPLISKVWKSGNAHENQKSRISDLTNMVIAELV